MHDLLRCGVARAGMNGTGADAQIRNACGARPRGEVLATAAGAPPKALATIPWPGSRFRVSGFKIDCVRVSMFKVYGLSFSVQG